MLRIIFSPVSEPATRQVFKLSKLPFLARLNGGSRGLWRSYVQFHTRSPIKLQAAGLIGALTFPLYYVVWTYVFPQDFESFLLRAAGTVLCLGLALRPVWPDTLARWYLPYAYVSFALCLPVFFTYMLLFNGGSSIWLLSVMAALIFVMLLYDIRNALIVCTVGSALGVGMYLVLSGSSAIPNSYWASVPVYVFLLAAIAAYSYTERPVTYEQLTAARALASNIAHEMRTPLLGIRLDSERLSSDMIMLEEAARWAYAHGWDENTALSDHQIKQMHCALSRIIEHARAANLVIEMLLANASQERNMSDDYAVYSLDDVIADALARYHFRPGERDSVHISGERGVKFWGSDVLMVHVIFNLLKNALTAIGTKKSGAVDIHVCQHSDRIELEVRDTGAGIPPDLLPCIFLPFISSSRRMEGSGMGLAFCKKVVESFRGTIDCTSELNQGSTFIVTLPLARV